MKNITTIFGAPGCGKTHYLMELMTDLLKTYKPDEIAFVSFTRTGAYDGRRRAIEKFGYDVEDFPYFRTLHSIAFASAGLRKSDVVTEQRYKEFSDSVGMSFTGYYTSDMTNTDDKYLFYYFLLKNNPVMADKTGFEGNMNVFDYVKSSYDCYKSARGYVDYTDMLEFFVEAKQPLPVKVAIIDEAQDLTTLQWRMCEVAFAECEHVYIAGDDDQAIYEWNGADVKYFLALNGERVILDRSYRMPSNVYKFATAISKRIRHRVDKVFLPRAEGGIVEIVNSLENFPFNNKETYYLLSRNNYYLKDYEATLRKKGLVYLDKNGKSVNDKLVQAIKAHEYRRREGKYKDDIDSIRASQYLLGKDVIEAPWYDALDMEESDKEYYRDLIANKTDLSKINFRVSTIHGVKGGEADNVILMMDMTRRTHKTFEENLDSELRCLYVGCTRAKKNLYIIPTSTRYGYDEEIPIAKIIKSIGEQK